MNQTTHNKIVSFIWGIADDVLRDLFKRGKYPGGTGSQIQRRQQRESWRTLDTARRCQADGKPGISACCRAVEKEAGVIKADEKVSPSRKFVRYLPFWS